MSLGLGLGLGCRVSTRRRLHFLIEVPVTSGHIWQIDNELFHPG